VAELPQLAADRVRRQADVLVASGNAGGHSGARRHNDNPCRFSTSILNLKTAKARA
jgi:hypothetical protein